MIQRSSKIPGMPSLFLLIILLPLLPTNQSPLAAPAIANTFLTSTSPTADYYTAGVVEFRPSSNSADSLQDNLAAYLEIVSSADAVSTDIIVFPESTLNGKDSATFVPNPQTSSDIEAVPCLLGNSSIYSAFLVQLSCGARRARKYLVINLTERENCATTARDPRPCANDGLNIFNTNVVFDREGRVISRYRKWNLYGEPRNTTYTLELGFFETDFGVRFGHFICFDILFYEPGQTLIELGINDILFSAMWFSQLPFLTAVQFQQSWSYANDVNLIAAGASRPAVGSTGSGIYAGRAGPLVSVMKMGEGERRLYVAQVPKKRRSLQSAKALQLPNPRSSQLHINQANIRLKRDYLDQYVSELIDLSNVSRQLKRQICYKTFCCNFELQWHGLGNTTNATAGQYYKYRLGAYEGMRDEPGADGTNALRNCAVFTCIGANIADCGKIFPAEVVQEHQVAFDRISIEADFETDFPALIMPNSLRGDMLPLSVNEFMWEESKNADGTLHVRYTLNTTTPNLLAFAIYGNFFDGKGFIERPSSTSPPVNDTNANGNGVGTLLQPIVVVWISLGLVSIVLI